METLTQLHHALQPYYSVIAIVLTWVGLGVAWRRHRGQWISKEFLGQVNFSLNLIGDTLAMRTLHEDPTNAIWPNTYGLRLLNAAAKRTTDTNPFIRLARKEDRDYLHRSVKNALSQLCPEVFVAAALGVPVRRGTFLFAITCERYPEMRTVKLRVLLIEEATLREAFAPGGRAEKVRAGLSVYYRTRLNTLQMMYEMDRKAQAGGEEELGRVELGIPVGTAG
jgi:hypothetical protein